MVSVYLKFFVRVKLEKQKELVETTTSSFSDNVHKGNELFHHSKQGDCL